VEEETGTLAAHSSGDKVPVVDDSSRDDSQVVGVTVGAVVASIVVTQSDLYRGGLRQLAITSDAAKLLIC
jgi:hypothetical protein